MKLLGKIGKALIIFMVASILMTARAAYAAPKETMDPEATLIVPVKVLEDALRDTLPMEIEQLEGFTGKLWVRSIEKLYLGKNVVSFKARLQGKDLGYAQKIAGYKAAMKFGEVDLAFDCSASFSHDRKRRVLIFKPRIHPAEKGKDLVTPLLMALFNEKEYLVEIDKIEPVATQIGKTPLLVHMDVTSIATLDNRLMIGIAPKIQKEGKKK